ncbi:hypothetical protein QSV34_13735 [Porticoccus sp. W117]|uniref:hypothetical protein n=1 Tax=Porticoccus sp. W117 TaxID=3054777 RepID=UPI0025913F35|nr:hypothetical protein [Porticoccus sp. W117]MDM3872409.1 hypothetical protein [Porticoccus sp. W117]
MLNYRIVALLILLTSVISPLAFQWFTHPDGSWLRPYVAWLLLIVSSALVYRRRRRRGQV